MAVTITEERFDKTKKITFDWTSAADGSASDTTTYEYTGRVVFFITDPDGISAPTDNYDITITDEDGVDILAGAGANRDTANTEYVLESSLGACGYDKLTINITNAGDTKKGKAYLYIKQ